MSLQVFAGLLLDNAPCSDCRALMGKGEIGFALNDAEICGVCLRRRVLTKSDAPCCEPESARCAACGQHDCRCEQKPSLREIAWELLVDTHNKLIRHGLGVLEHGEPASAVPEVQS